MLGTTLGIESIAEFEVLTNTYSAQFGGNGAVVNTASKSGTNSFHGSAYEFFRNSALDARNFFDPSQIPAYRQNQFGGSIGGPIKKDKLFFFFNDEELRKSQGSTVPAFIPDANVHKGLVPCSAAPNLACVGRTGERRSQRSGGADFGSLSRDNGSITEWHPGGAGG